ncbi:MAG: DUF4212 domain-containing protein [Desulfuromonadaceae bacterium]
MEKENLAAQDININFFRPVGDFMTKDVTMTKIILLVWFVAVYGFLFLLKLVADPNVTAQVTLSTGEVVTQVVGKSFLTETRFLGFPFHFWYSAQFCIALFIVQCWWYCKFSDKLEAEYGKSDKTK